MISLNGLMCRSARVLHPSVGVWSAELEVDLAFVPIVPSGPAVLTIGTTPLRCYVQPDASGEWIGLGKVRVIGGMNGWSKTVTPLHFHNDAGVLSTTVYATTAAEVLEVVVDPIPTRLGVDYVRAAGPASRIFGDRPWRVDPVSGTTFVGPRIPVPANPLDVELLEWDPVSGRATLSAESLLSPGTLLVDVRLGTKPKLVGDVEQLFGPDKARATAWLQDVATSIPSRLGSALRTLVREASGVTFLRSYRYRVIAQAGKRLILQPVDILGPLPPTLPVDIWYGLPGAAAKVLPGAEVMVSFQGGDPACPVVEGFGPAPTPPIEVSIDALRMALGSTTTAEVSVEALRIALGGALAVKPVALAPELIAWAAGVVSACALATPPIVIPPLPVTVAATKVFGV